MSDMAAEDTAYRDQLFDLLCRVHRALDRHGIWHCLLFGTLLGAVRDGDIIAWDHDLDLLVRPCDIDRLVAANAELRAEGLWFWTGKGLAERLPVNAGGAPWQDFGYIGIMDGESCRGELYAPTLFADGVLRLYDLEQEVAYWPQSSFPAWFVEELETATVRGVELPVPRRADVLLEGLYGPDWRTPYRSQRDGGEARDGAAFNGDLAGPTLAAQVAWCERQGWDRTVYRAQPAWPRGIEGAGPSDGAARTRTTSASAWWHTPEEIGLHY